MLSCYALARRAGTGHMRPNCTHASRCPLAASQYERSFLPHRLNNWETPNEANQKQDRFGPLPARTGKTTTIVEPNGHLKATHKKTGTSAAFTTTKETSRPVYAASKPRWPTVGCSHPLASQAAVEMFGCAQKQLWGHFLKSGSTCAEERFMGMGSTCRLQDGLQGNSDRVSTAHNNPCSDLHDRTQGFQLPPLDMVKM